MRWQPGGNLEPVRIICETDWKQCIRAILRYIWMEVVTDVVDCLTTKATLWREGLYTCKIIAICIICLLLLLLRVLYMKRKWTVNTVPPSKYILNSVGCKVDDLELKINILTYKLQYGTWPLPYQILNPKLKKQLRNLRLTLSTSNDRNSWIKHMLLNSTSKTYSSSSKLDSTSLNRMTELFDTKMGYVSSEIKPKVFSNDQQQNLTIESLKTNSVESVKKMNSNDIQQLFDGFSRRENLESNTCRQVTKQLSLLPRKNSDSCSLKKLLKDDNSKLPTSRSKITNNNGCDKYIESIEECKRFLRELKESNKRLELNCSSSEISEDSSSTFFKTNTDDKSSSLHAQTTDARNATERCEIIGQVKGTIVKVQEQSEINNQETFVDTYSNGLLQINQINNNRSLTSLNLSIHDDNDYVDNFLSKNLTYNSTNDNVILMSQETLYQIKRKLENLENVLRKYGVTLNSPENNIEELRKEEENNNEKCNDIKTIYRKVVDTNDKMKNEIDNERNNLYLDLNNTKYNDKMLQTNSSDWELFESIDSEENNSTISMKKSHSEGSIIVNEEESYKTNDDLILNEKFITSNDFLKEDKKELLSEFIETYDDPSSIMLSTNSTSQLEILKDNDLEKNESTEMLIKEALQCKKELLHKLYSNVEIMNEMEEKTVSNNYKYDINDDDVDCLNNEKTNFQSKLLDIIIEESTISNCTEKTSGTYIFLQTKELSDELSIRSTSSLNVEINDDKKKDNVRTINDNVVSKMYNNLSKQIIPINNSSQYFSLNDLSILSEYENISLREQLMNNSKSIFMEKNKPSLQGKRRHEEIALLNDDDDDDDNIDDDRKRKCHRDDDDDDDDDDDKRLISYGELRKAKSFNMSFYQNDYNNVPNNINDILLRKKCIKNNAKNYTELLTKISNNDNNDNINNNDFQYDNNKMEETDDDLLSFNLTTDSSSYGCSGGGGSSIKYQLMIDNGSMTNLFSPTNSNLESKRCCCCCLSSSVIKKDDILYDHDLSLKRRPGMLSFAQLKMNTIIPDENDLFQNPYFLGETTTTTTTTMSEINCRESIEFNFIPISVISIDTHESNIFTMTREQILTDIKNDLSSSALRISYNNDRQNDIEVTEIIENENYESDDQREMQIIHENDNLNNILCISNIIDHRNDENDDVQDTMISQQHNVITQRSSSYFTGDTSSSVNKIDDFECCQESLSNIKMNNDSIKEIDIRNDILEYCINTCIDLLIKKETNKKDNESLQQLKDITKSKSIILNNNETSVSYIEKTNDLKLFKEVKSIEEFNQNLLENKSEGFIFDGSIRYKKSPVLDESDLKRNNNRTRNTTNFHSKFKITNNNNVKSKEPINVKGITYSKRYATMNNNNNSQLKGKSNFNIIIDNKDIVSDSLTKSYTRPNSCNMSREKSRFNGNINKNDFSSRSAVFSRSNNEQKYDKIKSNSEINSKCSSIVLTQPKSFSKSCIPILKSRLDSRKIEQHPICRPKSPIRGPLTMRSSFRNKIHTNDDNLNEINVIPTEGNFINKEDTRKHLDNSNKTIEKQFKTVSSLSSSSSLSFKEEKVNVIDEEDCNNITIPNEQTIIYVNIINHHDSNVTRILDPDKFLEYNKKKNVNESSSDPKFYENTSSSPFVIMTQEKHTLPKVVTIMSSTTPNNNNNNNNDIDSNDSKNLSNSNISSSGRLKNFWSFTIQQKEMEVSVKPSVTDTSTSMSDFLKINETIMPFHEHQIFGVPKELTNEEYSYLFEILTCKQNLGYLKEIQNLCNRLRLRNNTNV